MSDELRPGELKGSKATDKVPKSTPRKREIKKITIECLSTRSREVILRDGRKFYLTIGQRLTDVDDLVLTERLLDQIDKGIFKIVSEI